MSNVDETNKKNINPNDNPVKIAIEKQNKVLENANFGMSNGIRNLDSYSPMKQAIQDYNNKLNQLQSITRQVTMGFSEPLIKQYSPMFRLGIDRIVKNDFSNILGVTSKFNTIDILGVSKSLTNTMQHLIDVLNTSNIVKTLSDSLVGISNIFKDLDFSSISRLSGLDSSMLDKYYWVIPFEYDYDKLKKLSKYKTRIEFEKYMLNYFNDNRIKRMFSKVRRQCKDNDKKVLLKQVESAFFNDGYAICITSLITMLDGLTLELLEPNSDVQHLSYKAINDMLEYMNECPLTEFSYELYLKVDILNNFYQKLYEDEKKFKTTKRRLLSRHINSHGVKYLNKRVEVLRLLNAICFCQQILDETKLQEQFTRKRNEKKFNVVALNKNNNETD